MTDKGNVHTIWVPEGWSLEQVWTSIQRGEKIPLIEVGYWANVNDDGKEVDVDKGE